MTKNISLMNLVRIFIRRKTFFRACGRARKFFARAGKATLRKQHSTEAENMEAEKGTFRRRPALYGPTSARRRPDIGIFAFRPDVGPISARRRIFAFPTVAG